LHTQWSGLEARGLMPEFADKFSTPARALKETALALLVDIEEKDPRWIPKSQIDADSEVWKTGG
jgi:hypothetical protein